MGAMIVALIASAAPPMLVPLAGLAGPAIAWRRWTTRRRIARRSKMDVADLCDLTCVGLSGGLSLQPALALAAGLVGGAIESEVAGILRRSRVDGLSTTLLTAPGAGSRLYRVVGQAVATGSSLVGPVGRLAGELEAELAAAELEAVRRLPVLMLFPLTMLILPGFLLVVVAPAVLDAFGRLSL